MFNVILLAASPAAQGYLTVNFSANYYHSSQRFPEVSVLWMTVDLPAAEMHAACIGCAFAHCQMHGAQLASLHIMKAPDDSM
jgi:hypothetical protein